VRRVHNAIKIPGEQGKRDAAYTRIVDLPQLIKLLRCDMSLVDPAAVRPDFLD
jgi:hypothetical protein